MSTIDYSRPVCGRCGLRNAALPLTTCGDCYREVHGDTAATLATLLTVTPAAELRRQRAALGLSQAQLGAALGADRQTIARWEAGVLRIRHPRTLALALWALAHGAEKNAEISPKTA